MSRNRHLTLLGGAVVALGFACQFEPDTPKLVYTLNEKEFAKPENETLATDASGRAHLKGALEFLFGSPQDPSFAVLPDWVDDEFNPNYWGSDLLYASEEDWDELVASNERAFAAQLEIIENGTWEDFDSIREPLYAEDLWESWLAFREEVPTVDDPDGGKDEEGGALQVPNPDGEYEIDGEVTTWRDEALYLWTRWYPTLSTTANMYRAQCWHCHGASGGGNGTTAEWLNPLPRDYRNGIFKFTALNDKARPRHEDLMRILEEGIYTTAMPSFRRFSDAQLSGLADYVRLLSIRGETEILMISDYDPEEGIHFENLQENYELVVDRWLESPDKTIVYDGEVPHSTPERIERGRDLYMRENAANCVKCHGTRGLGDGESVKNNPEDATDDWGNPIKPRNLTTGVFRFGRRPIDIYRRLYAGINGGPMPAHYDMQIVDGEDVTRNMNEEDLWDLVFYVRSLSVEDHDEHAEDEHAGGDHEDDHADEGGH